jgi:hypothetical protein
MNRTVTVEDRTYTIAPMTFGQGREIFKPDADPFEANCAMVAACLNNAHVAPEPALSAADVQSLPYPDGQALVLACMELNGLRSKGEAGAAQDRPSEPKAGSPGTPDAA